MTGFLPLRITDGPWTINNVSGAGSPPLSSLARIGRPRNATGVGQGGSKGSPRMYLPRQNNKVGLFV